MRSEYQCVQVLSPCCMDADTQPKSSGAACPQTCRQTKKSTSSLFYFHVLRSHMKQTSYEREKEGGKTVTLMFPLQFFIEAGLRGQVLRKTSLCGEKCTGNKPKWHWEVRLSAMINGTYASWMCLVPLPCWLPPLRAGSCLLGLAWSSNLNPAAWGSTLTGRRRRRRDCQEFWLTLCSFALRLKWVQSVIFYFEKESCSISILPFKIVV